MGGVTRDWKFIYTYFGLGGMLAIVHPDALDQGRLLDGAQELQNVRV